MSMAGTYVRARIDPGTKERATEALEKMGLSVSDAIRLLMLRIAEEHRMPFEIKVPNATCVFWSKRTPVLTESGQPIRRKEDTRSDPK